MKKALSLILRVVISLVAIGALVYFMRGKFVEAIEVLKRGIGWDWLAISIVAYFAALALISKRLQLVFKVQEVRLSFWETLYLSMVGMFFTLFFPSAMGGDIAKGYFAYQYSGKKLGSLTGVLLDRALGLVTLCTLSLGAVLLYGHQLEIPAMRHTLYALTAFLIFGFIFFTNHSFAKKFGFLFFLLPSEKLREKVTDLYHAVREYKNHKQLLVTCCMISVAAQVIFLVQNYFLAKALAIQIELWPFFILMPLVAFVSMAPSLSGLGVREAGFVFFFKSFIPAEEAFALTILYDLIFYGSALLGGLMFAVKGGLKKELLEGLEKVEEQETIDG